MDSKEKKQLIPMTIFMLVFLAIPIMALFDGDLGSFQDMIPILVFIAFSMGIFALAYASAFKYAKFHRIMRQVVADKFMEDRDVVWKQVGNIRFKYVMEKRMVELDEFSGIEKMRKAITMTAPDYPEYIKEFSVRLGDRAAVDQLQEAQDKAVYSLKNKGVYKQV